jgi:hypothetical protein
MICYSSSSSEDDEEPSDSIMDNWIFIYNHALPKASFSSSEIILIISSPGTIPSSSSD